MDCRHYSDGQWWGREIFELVSDGTTTSTGSTDDNTKIRGYYVHVTGVTPVGEVILGLNATFDVTVEYNFLQVPLVVSILDDQLELRAQTSDEISDYGENVYTLSMVTGSEDTDKVFYAVAHYFIDGNWTAMDPKGYMAFSLDGESSGISGGSDIPEGLDLSGIDVEKISRALNETIAIGLDYIRDIEIPDEIKEKTGIPGFPVEAIFAGAALLGLALKKRE